MKHWRADIDQHGTIIRMGIFDAVDLSAAKKLFDEIVTWAQVIAIHEVDPVEVQRIRNRQPQPSQLTLPGL